jgi:mycofactocin precursor
MFMEPKSAATVPPADAAVTPVEPPVPMALKEGGPAGEKPRILEDVVIEEVSIDGMCGVY